MTGEVLQYLLQSGALTYKAGESDLQKVIYFDGKDYTIREWKFNEPPKTIQELEAISQTKEFKDFIKDKDRIIEKKRAITKLDGELKDIVSGLLDEINVLRQVQGLPPKNIGQLKAAINSKD